MTSAEDRIAARGRIEKSFLVFCGNCPAQQPLMSQTAPKREAMRSGWRYVAHRGGWLCPECAPAPTGPKLFTRQDACFRGHPYIDGSYRLYSKPSRPGKSYRRCLICEQIDNAKKREQYRARREPGAQG